MDVITKERLSLCSLSIILVALPFYAGGRDVFGFLLVVLFLLPLLFFIKEGLPTWKNKLVFSFIIFLAITAVATITSSNFYASFGALLWWLIYFFVFISAIALFRERKNIDVISKILVAVAVVVGSIGIIYFLKDDNVYLRMYSVLEQHNALGGFLLLPIFLTLGYFLSSTRTVLQIAWGITGIFLLAILFLTFSRGSILSLMLAGIVVAALSSNKESIKSILFAAGKILTLFVGGGILAFLIFNLHHNLQATDTVVVYQNETSEANGFSLRVHYWKDALQIFTTQPLLGVGPGNYPEGNRVYRSSASYFTLDPHNQYVKILVETGVGGIVLWAFFILFGVTMYRFIKKNSGDYTALALSAGVLAILIHIGMDIDWRYPVNALIFFTFAGALVTQAEPVAILDKKYWGNALIVVAILTVVCGVIIFISINNLEDGKFYISRAKDDLAREELLIAEKYNFFKNSDVSYWQGRLESDVSYYDKAISYAPHDTRLYVAKADLLRKKGDISGEEFALIKAIEYNRGGSYLTTIQLSQLYLKEKKYSELIYLVEKNLPWFESYISRDVFKSDPGRWGITETIKNLKEYLAQAKLEIKI